MLFLLFVVLVLAEWDPPATCDREQDKPDNRYADIDVSHNSRGELTIIINDLDYQANYDDNTDYYHVLVLLGVEFDAEKSVTAVRDSADDENYVHHFYPTDTYGDVDTADEANSVPIDIVKSSYKADCDVWDEIEISWFLPDIFSNFKKGSGDDGYAEYTLGIVHIRPPMTTQVIWDTESPIYSKGNVTLKIDSTKMWQFYGDFVPNFDQSGLIGMNVYIDYPGNLTCMGHNIYALRGASSPGGACHDPARWDNGKGDKSNADFNFAGTDLTPQTDGLRNTWKVYLSATPDACQCFDDDGLLENNLEYRATYFDPKDPDSSTASFDVEYTSWYQYMALAGVKATFETGIKLFMDSGGSAQCQEADEALYAFNRNFPTWFSFDVPQTFFEFEVRVVREPHEPAMLKFGDDTTTDDVGGCKFDMVEPDDGVGYVQCCQIYRPREVFKKTDAQVVYIDIWFVKQTESRRRSPIPAGSTSGRMIGLKFSSGAKNGILIFLLLSMIAMLF